eukprot:11222165-Prorocentrum_lima.AAC.1
MVLSCVVDSSPSDMSLSCVVLLMPEERAPEEALLPSGCWNVTVLGAFCFWSVLDVDHPWLRP